MCLAVPGRVVETFVEHDLRMARVDFGGMTKKICLEHVPHATPGDYVLVHVGFALARLDEAEALATLAMLKELGGLEEELAAEELVP
jgi:hydrogenase expression/formation protein HypC